jgi:hypothetical protein
MSKLRFALALSAAVLAGAAPTLADEALASDPHCEIRISEGSGVLRVESVVFGEPGFSGVYDFTLTRSGSGGASDVSQSGAYTIEADGEATLSVSEFNHGRNDRVDALLSLDTPDGRVECHERV